MFAYRLAWKNFMQLGLRSVRAGRLNEFARKCATWKWVGKRLQWTCLEYSNTWAVKLSC